MEKIWLENYPEGVPAEIDADAYASVVQLFESSCKDFANRPAFHNLGATLSYAEVDSLSRAFAAFLQKDLGLKKGDRVAIMMPNLLQYPIALFGILRAGLVVVNVNPLYTSRELEHQLNDSGAETIVIVANFAATLQECIKNTGVKNVVLTELGDMLPFLKRNIVNFVVKNVKKMVPPFSLPSAIPFRTALERGRTRRLDPVELGGTDIAFLQYTGGTTGVSKGAVLTHRNMVANLQQVSTWLGPCVTPGDVVVTPLPLYHIFALTANCLTFVKYGGFNILITNPRDIPAFIKELGKFEVNAITGVNTLFNALVNAEGFADLNFKPLKLSVGGGMAVQRAVAEKWKKITGVTLVEGYGLTEASPVVTVNPVDLQEYSGAIGLPISSTELSIRDDDGNEVVPGEEQNSGELWIKGPQVMQGYWQRPEESAKVLTEDGWLKTGDVATYDTRGYFKIVDRKKDMILVSGFNVYPNEIEDVVAQHPGVLEVAAIGVPDEKSGEVVKIFVVKKDQGLTEDALAAHCKEHLTGYKRPKHIEFRDELPKTNVGKILRRALRDEATKKAS